MIETFGSDDVRELHAIRQAVTDALKPFYQRQVPPLVAICALTIITRILLDGQAPEQRDLVLRNVVAFLGHGEQPKLFGLGSPDVRH